MKRNHIHFAPGILGEDNVISGKQRNVPINRSPHITLNINYKYALLLGMRKNCKCVNIH